MGFLAILDLLNRAMVRAALVLEALRGSFDSNGCFPAVQGTNQKLSRPCLLTTDHGQARARPRLLTMRDILTDAAAFLVAALIAFGLAVAEY